MKILTSVLGLLFLCSIYSLHGQTPCKKDDLLGEWRGVESIAGIYENTDSLKSVMIASQKSIASLQFREDGLYNYVFLDSQVAKNKQYYLDTTRCEVILGSRQKKRDRSNLEIIYLDNEILIFKEDNNPKGYVTHLFVKR